MTILYIYRNPAFGFSIGKVFKPIEEEMKKYAEVDSIVLPIANYSLIGLWKNIRYARRAVKQKHYDVVHITGSEHYLIPFLCGQKVVVTVHDLGSILNKNMNYIAKKVKKWLFISSLQYASSLTFISKSSMEEAIRMVDLANNKKAVIPNAVDSSYIYSNKNFNKDCPIILHLGTKANKNLLRIAQALKGINCKLRIIGKLKDEQIKVLNENHVDYSVKEGLTDIEIFEEYKNCDIVSFPSLYEGFGMPIIEGQSVGRVVVTSNMSPMKEVAGGGAILVDPYDVKSIRHGFEEAILNSGAREAYLIEEPMAAAIGAGLNVVEPTGSMIIDIGGGTTEVAVISLGGIVISNSIKVAGDEIDEDIINFVKNNMNLAIGSTAAEEVKMELGCAMPPVAEKTMEIRGRELTTGLPENRIITASQVQKAIEPSIEKIIDLVKATLEKTPPELASDIVERGITLAGGGALIKDIDILISKKIEIPVFIAERPLECVASGTGKVIEDVTKLRSALINKRRR